MKLLTQNAAIQLFEKVKSLEEQPVNTWRCIHINLAENGEYNAGLRMNFFVRPIAQMLKDEDGYIFACDDGDIFILFKGPIAAIMDKLDDHYGDIDAVEEDNNSLFNVFDLSVYWDSFIELCAVKSRRAIQDAIPVPLRKSSWSPRLSDEPLPQ